jgi:fluoroacetyl-CoA thioesterase
VGEPTDSATIETVVTRADTARALSSGEVEVLGTPRALALAEAATVLVAAARLRPGQTSVGAHVELDHLAPTPVGATVQAEATLVYRTGRRLTFDVRVTQGGRTVATGRITRAIVDKAAFEATAVQPEQAGPPKDSPGYASTDDLG